MQVQYFLFAILLSAAAQAETKYLDDVLATATAQEKADLGKVLQQIQMVPAEDPQTHKRVFKVLRVDKGSVYERAGIKVGDFVAAGSSRTGNRFQLNPMDIKQREVKKTK